ncbi:replication/maintenance protein RepL [Streptomyces sp. NPDC026673]|uniref:replication/maintenance protein RepL n=1 Tax=Streptomyces sp. NPDC026673 TaxID=3155724 RepID=UPI0033D218D5
MAADKNFATRRSIHRTGAKFSLVCCLPERERIMPVPEPARPLRRRGSPSPAPLQPAGHEHHTDLAAEIAHRYAGTLPSRVYEARTVFYRRAPHDMLGKDGYSLVSNFFARHVLPQALMSGRITKLQAAVLSNLIGRQERGLIQATQQELSEEIGAGRTSVGPALNALCEMNLVRKLKRGQYQLNPTIAYNGNGDTHAALLGELRSLDLDGFPDELHLFPLDQA